MSRDNLTDDCIGVGGIHLCVAYTAYIIHSVGTIGTVYNVYPEVYTHHITYFLSSEILCNVMTRSRQTF